MASVHALAMDRPSPCPGLLAMRVSSPRWNGWIRSSASAAFSGGLVVLSMVMMVWFSPAWTVQVMAWAAEHLLRDAGSEHGLDPSVPVPALGSGERPGRPDAQAGQACHRAERTRRPQPVDQQGLLPVRQAPQAGTRAEQFGGPLPPHAARQRTYDILLPSLQENVRTLLSGWASMAETKGRECG